MIDFELTRKIVQDAQERVNSARRQGRMGANSRELLAAKYAWLEREIANLNQLRPPRRVFISFSTRAGGEKIYAQIERKLSERNFEVYGGLGGGQKIVPYIVSRLKQSSVYVGVMGRVSKLQGPRPVKYSPGAWVVAETGMALALQKPIVLFIHDRVDPQYWEMVSERDHPRFNDDNLLQQVGVLVDAVEQCYLDIESGR